MKIAFILTFAASMASAECPPSPDIAQAQSDLLAQSRQLTNERDGRAISGKLWALWATAPDEPSQALLDRGMRARESFNFVDAFDAFNKLVDYCPDYAEGYNQRAFVSFLREDYAKALVDLDLALERHPEHVAAMSGKALTLMGLGRQEEAQVVLREALKLNPWIPERGLLQKPIGEKL